MNLQNLQNPTTFLQSNIQYNLINKFSTGDPFFDSMIHTIIYSFMTLFLLNIGCIFNSGNLNWFINSILTKFRNFFNKYILREVEYIHKEVIIDCITEEKKANNLYKALDWYLSVKQEIDFIKESPIRLSYEDDCFLEKNQLMGLKLNKRLTMNNYKLLKFKNHEIFYIINKDIITIYADKERKRENFKITLTCKIRKDSTTDILEEFCQHALNMYIKSKISNVWTQKIFINDEAGEWKCQDSNNKRKLETVILKDNMLEEIKRDLDTFLKSEDWYNDWGIPFTRGYLFYGKPGCGKTSLIKGISTYTKRHIHYLMLNNIKSDNQLLDMLKKINYKETILVLEDIDCMTKLIENRDKSFQTELKESKESKQSNETIVNELKKINEQLNENRHKSIFAKEQQLTLSGILNAIDGIFSNDGRIMIMTTNHPEVLDSALIRPGRIDRKVHFDYCNHQQIREIFKMMFGYECSKESLNDLKECFHSPAEVVSTLLKFRDNPQAAIKDLINIVDSS